MEDVKLEVAWVRRFPPTKLTRGLRHCKSVSLMHEGAAIQMKDLSLYISVVIIINIIITTIIIITTTTTTTTTPTTTTTTTTTATTTILLTPTGESLMPETQRSQQGGQPNEEGEN